MLVLVLPPCSFCYVSYGRIVGGMYSAMTQKHVALFFSLSAANFGLDILTAFVEEGSNYLRTIIGVKWKVALSARLRALFIANDAFYKVKHLGGDIIDPANRITQVRFADYYAVVVGGGGGARFLRWGMVLTRFLAQLVTCLEIAALVNLAYALFVVTSSDAESSCCVFAQVQGRHRSCRDHSKHGDASVAPRRHDGFLAISHSTAARPQGVATGCATECACE